MTEETGSESINVVLSREELLLVLELLEVEYLPGLDSDPLGDLSAEGRELALTVAGRGLMARGLAQIDEDGTISLHTTLLNAVGNCAYANNTIFVYHWQTAGEVPTRYFGHVRDGEAASHRRPDDVLHLFTLLPSKSALIDEVLEICEYQETTETDLIEIPVSADDFVQVRERAFAGDESGALELLASTGSSADAAAAFVSTLSNAPRISVLQTLTQEEESVLKRDFTVIQDAQKTWFIAPTSEDDDNPDLGIRTAGREDIEELLDGAL